MTTDHLTDQQLDDLDEIEARAAHLWEYVELPADADQLAGTDAPALVAEVRRLRARVTELEGPAVEARAALAALCYDLEDPGSNAFGALYLLSQATVGVDAPKDDATVALARHDGEVLRKAAEVLEGADRDDDAVNLLYLLADQTARGEETHVVADDSDDVEAGTRLCGYGDYHDGHEWVARPDVWCPGHSYAAASPSA
jgi:signal transduction histidine kinase